jgi:hypothetical protein
MSFDYDMSLCYSIFSNHVTYLFARTDKHLADPARPFDSSLILLLAVEADTLAR